MSQLIKHTQGKLNPALTEEVHARLTQGTLQVQDLYFLLVRGEDTDLKRRLLVWLDTEVQDAASILAIAVSQEAAWEQMEYQEQPQERQFLAWVTVTVNGHQQTTQRPGQGTRKQVARHRACWLWLEGWTQETLVAPELRVIPEVQLEESTGVKEEVRQISDVMQQLSTQPLEDGHNHVGKLLEVCQALEWTLPRFEFQHQADGFLGICRLDCEGQSLVGTGTAKRKKLAKHRAALEILVQLKDSTCEVYTGDDPDPSIMS